MKQSPVLLKALALLLFFFQICVPFSFAAKGPVIVPFDHSAWGKFLDEYVNEQGEINYAAACGDRKILDAYLNKLAGLSLRQVTEKWLREEQLALWLNVYHAAIVAAVCERYPIKSMQEIPGVWEMGMVQVGKHRFGLDQIRKEKLVESFRDEKIHLALSCGARGCPRLRKEVFTGALVEGQLFQATREFVNDPARSIIDPKDRKVRLSRIFEWYARDFRMDFGVPENDLNLKPDSYAVLSFMAHYLEDIDKITFLQQGDYKLKYTNFDWSLNEWKPAAKSAPPASS